MFERTRARRSRARRTYESKLEAISSEQATRALTEPRRIDAAVGCFTEDT